MPELPDVEMFKRYLDATSLHQEVERVDVQAPDVLKGITPSGLKKGLRGRAFRSSRRHGKYLFVQVDGRPVLTMHFGMTGFLKYFKDPENAPPHDRVRFAFSNGFHLAYDSQRKLGEVSLVRYLDLFIKGKGLGPDAMDPRFDLSRFAESLSGSRAAVKSALMNQKLMAGIGSIYSDEILFQAGLHPRRQANRLDDGEVEDLFAAMKAVLSRAIECRADPDDFPPSFMIPHRREKGVCPRCGRDLESERISGRTGFFCTHCQS